MIGQNLPIIGRLLKRRE